MVALIQMNAGRLLLACSIALTAAASVQTAADVDAVFDAYWAAHNPREATRVAPDIVASGFSFAEAFAAIRATLDELPPGDREILTLRYALEYDATRIADLLGINATAVHMRLSRARQRLADRLTAQGTTAIP